MHKYICLHYQIFLARSFFVFRHWLPFCTFPLRPKTRDFPKKTLQITDMQYTMENSFWQKRKNAGINLFEFKKVLTLCNLATCASGVAVRFPQHAPLCQKKVKMAGMVTLTALVHHTQIVNIVSWYYNTRSFCYIHGVIPVDSLLTNAAPTANAKTIKNKPSNMSANPVNHKP